MYQNINNNNHVLTIHEWQLKAMNNNNMCDFFSNGSQNIQNHFHLSKGLKIKHNDLFV